MLETDHGHSYDNAQNKLSLYVHICKFEHYYNSVPVLVRFKSPFHYLRKYIREEKNGFKIAFIVCMLCICIYIDQYDFLRYLKSADVSKQFSFFLLWFIHFNNSVAFAFVFTVTIYIYYSIIAPFTLTICLTVWSLLIDLSSVQLQEKERSSRPYKSWAGKKTVPQAFCRRILWSLIER